MQEISTAMIDDPVAIEVVARLVKTPLRKLLADLKATGIWTDAIAKEELPAIFADTVIDFFNGAVPVTDDPEWPAIDDPGPPAALDQPYYALGDLKKSDMVLV